MRPLQSQRPETPPLSLQEEKDCKFQGDEGNGSHHGLLFEPLLDLHELESRREREKSLALDSSPGPKLYQELRGVLLEHYLELNL